MEKTQFSMLISYIKNIHMGKRNFIKHQPTLAMDAIARVSSRLLERENYNFQARESLKTLHSHSIQVM